jgi:plastocyanin
MLNRNLAVILIIIAFVSGIFISANTATAEKGGPFTEIWEAIFGLQTHVDSIEERLAALENLQSPIPPIVSDVIIPQGTSTPGCETTNECYLPYKAGVIVGSSLTWTNTDSAAHTVTSGSADDGPTGKFDSSLLFAGKTFSHTFDSVGEFPYFCMVHPWMEGVVIVIEDTGSEHVHAGILVKIFGDTFDFSTSDYQNKSNLIAFEGGDGTTIHRYEPEGTLGVLFDSLGIGLDDQCFVFVDGRSFCTDDTYSLRFFINEEQVDDIQDYVVDDDDKILISYGAETPKEIKSQLEELDNQPIIK